MCCKNGIVRQQSCSTPFPPLLKQLLKKEDYNSDERKEISENIRIINGRLGFASLCTKGPEVEVPGKGPYVYKVQGTFMRRVSCIEAANGYNPSYSQLYFIDQNEAERLLKNHPLVQKNSPFLLQQMTYIHNALRRINPYAGAYVFMHDYCQEMTRKGQHIPEMTLAFNRGAHLDARRYNEPLGLGVNEIAAVLFGNLDNNKDVKTRMLCVQLKHTGPESWRYLKVTDQNADPLTYPLFFPRGDSGWYEDMPLWHKSFPPDVIPPKPNPRAKKQTRQNRSAFIDDEAVDDDDAPQHQADEPQSKKSEEKD